MTALLWLGLIVTPVFIAGYLLGRAHNEDERERQFREVSAHMEAVLARADEQLGDGAR